MTRAIKKKKQEVMTRLHLLPQTTKKTQFYLSMFQYLLQKLLVQSDREKRGSHNEAAELEGLEDISRYTEVIER
jgi:hypothetical protein